MSSPSPPVLTPPTSWHAAWGRAQSSLISIRDYLAAIPEPDPRVIRVTQLDAEQLDQQLVYLLQEPLNKAIASINSSLKSRFEPELGLLIGLTLYKLSIWNMGASYGAKLQDLKYVIKHSDGRSFAPSGLPHRALFLHGTLTIVMPYIHTRLRTYALSHSWPDAPSTDRRRKAWVLLTNLEASSTLLSLLNFLSFLFDGRHRTIADRVVGMILVPSRQLAKRDVSYEFMNRQMVWHAFTEFLLFLLPHVSARSVRRRLARMLTTITALLPAPSSKLTPNTTPNPTKRRGKYYNLPLDQCAICADDASHNLTLSESVDAFAALTPSIVNPEEAEPTETETGEYADEPPQFPLNTPYLASCGDIYCYHCIAERMMRAADEDMDKGGWQCLRCAQRVEGAEREAGPAPPDRDSRSGSEFEDMLSSSDLSMSGISGSTRSDANRRLSD